MCGFIYIDHFYSNHSENENGFDKKLLTMLFALKDIILSMDYVDYA